MSNMRLQGALYLLLAPLASGRLGENAYPLKERQATATFTLEDMKDYELTYSDDSPAKVLDPFYLDLYETDGNLPSDPSLASVEAALQDFLEAELNAVMDEHDEVERVKVKAQEQQMITTSVRNPDLATLTGSRLQTQVNVTFDHEPSPKRPVVEAAVEDVMHNLTYFLTNLTAWADGDPELANVMYAERSAIGGDGDGDGDNNDNDTFIPITKDPDGDGSDSSGVGAMEIGLIVGGSCFALLVIAMLAARRRQKYRLALTESDVDMFREEMDQDGDIFSTELGFEAVYMGSSTSSGLMTEDMIPVETFVTEESPPVSAASMTPREEQSDVFSGLESNVESETTSPAGNSSVFSFLTGFFSAGEASTVLVSNTTKSKKPNISPSVAAAIGTAGATAAIGVAAKGTPHSRLSSLFTFSEEDEEDLLESDDENENPISPKSEQLSDEGGNQVAAAGNQVGILSPRSDKNIPSDEETPINASRLTEIQALSSDSDSSFGPQSSDVQSPRSMNTNMSHLLLSEQSSSINNSGLSCLGPTPRNATPSPAAKGASALATSPDPSDGSPNIIKKEIEGEKSVWFATRTFGKLAKHTGKLLKRVSPRNTEKAYKSDSDTPAARRKTPYMDEEGYITDPGPGFTMSETSSPPEIHLRWDSPEDSRTNAAKAAAFVDAINSSTTDGVTSSSQEAVDSHRKSRRHTMSTAEDGTSDYQKTTMHPVEGVMEQLEANSFSDSEVSIPGEEKGGRTPKATAMTPKSRDSMSLSTTSSEMSASKRLLTDLVWLEKKIAGAAKQTLGSPASLDAKGAQLNQCDSLSFASGDGMMATSESCDSSVEAEIPSKDASVPVVKPVQSIVCRDCFAPPGKLKIVIHSTKDGPAVHTVKKGSSLEGHIFPGDLIISVDNVDTRSYTAEQVMKMMTARTRMERKITVLHFENKTEGNN